MPGKAQHRGGHSGGHERAGTQQKSRASRTANNTQRRRRELRATTGRVQDAMAQVLANRKWLEAELSKQVAAGEPETRMTPADYAVVASPDPWREGDIAAWPLGSARLLIKDGYSLTYAVKRTGWGEHWFRDLVGADGYAKDDWSMAG